jgi:type III secretion protein C
MHDAQRRPLRNLAIECLPSLNAMKRSYERLTRAGLLYTLLFILLGAMQPASALDIPWKKEINPLKYTDRPIIEVLLGLLSANDITANISDNVKGTASIRIDAGDSRRVFDSLCRTNGLVWFYDGQVVSVVAASEQVTKIINVNESDVSRINSALSSSGLLTKRLPFKYVADSSTFIVTGPNRYVSLVEEVIQGVAKRRGKGAAGRSGGGAIETRVFRLKNAWADDLTFPTDFGVTRVPGVASVLRAQFGYSTSTRPMNVSLDGLSPAAGDGAGGVSSKTLDAEGNATTSTDNGFPSPRMGNFQPYGRIDENPQIPRINADARTNSIVITDTANRMAQYEKTINMLDGGSPIIEIEVAIIEIEAGTARDIGIDWQFDGTRPKNSPNARSNPTNLLAYGAGQLTTRLTKNGLDAFMANIRLLSTEGRAKVIQRPRVITVDNFEALIGTSEKSFVRVAGRDAVALYPVSTGLTLRVRPRVLGEFTLGSQASSLMLHVNIEDGKNTGQLIDGIPTQKRNVINTQTVVRPLESVVLGGQIVESDSDFEAGIPGLKDIPIVGNAFKNTSTGRKKLERLFIISPRVINQGSESLAKRDMPGLMEGISLVTPPQPPPPPIKFQPRFNRYGTERD